MHKLFSYFQMCVCVCVCVWLVFLVLVSPLPLSAASIPLTSVPVGKVFSVNGMKFAKISNDPVKGAQFSAVCEIGCKNDSNCLACSTQDWNYCTQCKERYKPVGGTCVPETYPTMQEWDGCSELATPSATLFTQGPILSDARDGKTYEIRKFADGKCWMVENLMYGGVSDNCAGNGATEYTDATYGGANGRTTPSNRFGINTYGNCRDPRVDGTDPCTVDSTVCGYHYNWQAAMQLPSAYYGVNVSYPNGLPSTTNFHQGICPEGWHVPAGGADGEFTALNIANGGVYVYIGSCGNAQCSFWRPGNNFKGVYSGMTYSSTAGVGYQGSRGIYWSSTQNHATYANYLDSGVDNFSLSGGYDKSAGYPVRCIKD